MKKKLTAITALGVAAVLALSGCGGGDTAADGKVTLKMVESLTNPTRTETLKTLLAGFEKENPNITVDLISPPTDSADQKIQQMLQSGKGIDVVEARDITVGSFGANKWLYDMSSDLKDWDGWENLTENAVNYSKQDGKTYYIPYGFYGLSLFYRTDLVKDAGFSGPPASWQDLLEQSEKLNQPDSNKFGYAFRGGTNANSNAVAVIEAYTADQIDKENAFKLSNGKTIFSAPEAQTAMDDYLELFKKGSPPSSVAWGYPEMVQGFSNGSTAFLLQDPEVIATVKESKSIKADQWSVAPLLTGPTGKAIQPVATAGWGIAESSTAKPEAVKLIKYLSQGEPATQFSKDNSLVPILKSAAKDPYYSTGPWAAYVTMTENPETYISAVQPRGVAWWTEWIKKSDGELQRVLTGKMTTKELLASWDSYWTEKMAG
ncbi:multiple sugar transport system substrate-binding protein [Arthrobacter alpinus]|uniref:Multiple sugar transport system substrate-binding protein n=1 Tax=Arthrobacter alpinus TaxID=656366 RepID=A0A1H5F4G7_9MICC|nr:sugar ABC transporter substrate-binding protein [Arthrobacter alpinus]SED98327.1 multiple sugar transport system substrate-binding protein [Arthrobacter alpinus]